jgi:hypothetical protein
MIFSRFQNPKPVKHTLKSIILRQRTLTIQQQKNCQKQKKKTSNPQERKKRKKEKKSACQYTYITRMFSDKCIILTWERPSWASASRCLLRFLL